MEDNADARELLENMLAVDPSRRFDLDQIAASAWMSKGGLLSSEELIHSMQSRKGEADSLRHVDQARETDFAHSIQSRRALRNAQMESPESPVYTSLHTHALTRCVLDNGWQCDGGATPSGCMRGCAGFSETKGWVRPTSVPCEHRAVCGDMRMSLTQNNYVVALRYGIAAR